MGIFSEAVDVEYSAQGVLERLVWRGVPYNIQAQPLCWYERRPWWKSDERLPPGAGVGAVDTQMWRLVLKDGEAPAITLDVAHYRPSGRWRVIKIYDAVDATDFTDAVEIADFTDAVEIADDADLTDDAGTAGPWQELDSA